ncbi:MAG: GH3 auxin-responsive promoter family protein [Bacteroidota bacterium]
MKIKSILAKPFAGYIYKNIQRSKNTAIFDQENCLKMLLQTGKNTLIGKEMHLQEVQQYREFAQAVPLRDYEQFRPYIDKIIEGHHHVLWKGLPIYFAKTSGTTSGVKYIPITKDSVNNHFGTARNAALCYASEKGDTSFFDGKLIFLSGSPELERVGGIPTGRLSGISNHLIPKYLRSNQLPSYETNCIEDWEEKLQKIVDETIHQNMTLISGIPPWVQMYFDELIKRTGKSVGEIFPSFQVLIQGGVNFEPYKSKLFGSIGRKVDCIEVFPASEGFFAFQDSQDAEGMLLNTNDGIFYEFIPLKELHKENPQRLPLHEVKSGEQYALVITTNAGLWAYMIGDIVKFVSTNPYRLVVTGRVKHYISAFGEHVIGEEVEESIQSASEACGVKIIEFTVAPMVQQGNGKSYHEWFIEFDQLPADIEAFRSLLNAEMCRKNIYYEDLIAGNILQPLVITPVRKNGFIDYMKSIGKLGGQNKVPRLTNDRELAAALAPYCFKL